MKFFLVLALLLATSSVAQTRCDACRLVSDPGVVTAPTTDPNLNRIVFKETFAVGAVQLVGDVLTVVIVSTIISALLNGGTGGFSITAILEQIGRLAAGVLLGAIVAVVHLIVSPAYAGLAAGFVAEKPTKNSRGFPLLVTYAGLATNVVALILFAAGGALFTPVGIAVAVAFSIALRYVVTPALASWVLHKDFTLGSGELLDAPPFRDGPSMLIPARWIAPVDLYGREARSFGGI